MKPSAEPMHGSLKPSHAWFLALMLIFAPSVNLASANQAKSTILRSRTVTIPGGFTVDSNEVLVIQPGTNVRIGSEERIWINGRINVLERGTPSLP